MKKHSAFILLMAATVAFSGCKKHEEPPRLKGRIMLGCDLPASNVTLSYRSKSFIPAFSIYETFETDSLGYFDHIFKEAKHGSGSLKLQNHEELFINLPVAKGKTRDIGTFYAAIPLQTKVFLEVENAYTENDTLVFGNHKIPGPFESQVLDSLYIQTFYPRSLHYASAIPQDQQFPGGEIVLGVQFRIVSNGEVLFYGSDEEVTKLYLPLIENICESSAIGNQVFVIK